MKKGRQEMEEVYVVSVARTAIGKIGGALKNVQPENLLFATFQGLLNKSEIDKQIIDEVICGQAKQTTDAPNISRVCSLMAEIPESVPAYTVHRQCASGMQAILNGMQEIQCGYADVVLTGGVESMSTAPFYARGVRFGIGNGNSFLVDPNTESQPKSQPSNIYGEFTMIQTADNVSRKFGISRAEQDEFAFESQQKAIKAIDMGKFKDEIIPVHVPQRKGKTVIFDTDEFPKRDTSLEKLAALSPIFQDGFVTAGNASGRNDGASAILLMSGRKVKELGLKPIARILGGVAAGVDPRIMGVGPVASTRKLLSRLSGIKIEDFSLVEINEAFAAQAIACIKELNLNPNIVNVNGGAIALGHPLGCSGSRISTTLLCEMQRRDVRYGLASICVAGGLGMSMAFEKV